MDQDDQALVELFAAAGGEFDPRTRLARLAYPREDRVTEAYVTEPVDSGILDIAGAQAVYLRQSRTATITPHFGRQPLRAWCTDEKCRRLANPPAITPIAYTEVAEVGAYKRAPHWRWESDHWHDPFCELLLRELALRQVRDRVAVDVDEEVEAESYNRDEDDRRVRGVQRNRLSDHFDVFRIDAPAPAPRPLPVPLLGAEDPPRPAAMRVAMRRARRSFRKQQGHASEARFLRQIVANYDRLKAEGRNKTEMLTIAGKTRSFYDWFRIVGLYDHSSATKEPRIWSGGAGVSTFLTAYRLDFIDTVHAGVSGKPSLILPFALLERHQRGPYLREAIIEAIQGYVKCYWYGALRVQGQLIVPDIGENLNLVHLAPRRSQSATRT